MVVMVVGFGREQEEEKELCVIVLCMDIYTWFHDESSHTCQKVAKWKIHHIFQRYGGLRGMLNCLPNRK
jgi:hypothetical protein